MSEHSLKKAAKTMKPISRKNKDRSLTAVQTKQKIVNATLTIAAEKGFDQATTAEIARKAGVSEGSIYNYFRTKDDLLIHTVAEYAGSFISVLEAAIAAEPTPLRKLERLIAFHINFFTQEGNIFQIIYGKRPGAKVQMARILTVAVAPYAELIERILQEGIAFGHIENINSQVAASFLLGGMQLTLLRRFFDMATYSAEETIAEIKRIYLNGLSTPGNRERPQKSRALKDE
jgi:TetR/AcrR family fatty acid metabolism transcriptional regulator